MSTAESRTQTGDADGPRDAALERANQLVTDHLYLVQHLVNQVAVRFPRHVDRQELWNSGAAGLVEASRRYDPDTGVPFARYASIRIRGAIIDSTRTRDWATRSVRRDLRTMRESAEGFEQEHGRTPTTEELASLLGVTPQEVEARQSTAVAATLLHLDQRVAAAPDGEDPTLGELVPEENPVHLPDEAVEDRELVGTLHTAIDFLPENQREVVQRYYFDGELLRDIADSMAVTEARVSQIRAEALNALRAYFGSAFEGAVEVAASAPGRRSRVAFAATVSEHSTWRDRLAAADRAAASSAYSGASRTA